MKTKQVKGYSFAKGLEEAQDSAEYKDEGDKIIEELKASPRFKAIEARRKFFISHNVCEEKHADGSCAYPHCGCFHKINT